VIDRPRSVSKSSSGDFMGSRIVICISLQVQAAAVALPPGGRYPKSQERRVDIVPKDQRPALIAVVLGGQRCLNTKIFGPQIHSQSFISNHFECSIKFFVMVQQRIQRSINYQTTLTLYPINDPGHGERLLHCCYYET